MKSSQRSTAGHPCPRQPENYGSGPADDIARIACQTSQGTPQLAFCAEMQRLSPQGRKIKSSDRGPQRGQNFQHPEHNLISSGIDTNQPALESARSPSSADVKATVRKTRQPSVRSLSESSHFWWRLGLLYSDVPDFTYSQPGLTQSCCSPSPRTSSKSKERQGRRPSTAMCIKQV
jgi:hypothetical protein